VDEPEPHLQLLLLILDFSNLNVFIIEIEYKLFSSAARFNVIATLRLETSLFYFLYVLTLRIL